jgi:hypothetical protein
MASTLELLNGLRQTFARSSAASHVSQSCKNPPDRRNFAKGAVPFRVYISSTREAGAPWRDAGAERRG